MPKVHEVRKMLEEHQDNDDVIFTIVEARILLDVQPEQKEDKMPKVVEVEA